MMKEKSQSKLVFVRHAHRDKPIPDQDNGISERGHVQVLDLLKDYKSGHLPKSQQFWSSPKKRCIETLKPLSDQAGSNLSIEALLDERHERESSSDFLKRIEGLLEKAKNEMETVYLCSHGDLIPEALELLTGKAFEVAKGQALVAENRDDIWEIL